MRRRTLPRKSSVGMWFAGIGLIGLIYWLSTKDDAASGGGCKADEEMIGTKCLVKCTDGQIRVGEVCQVNNNILLNNPLQAGGHLFGTGYEQLYDLEIAKSLDDVNTLCYPKCADDPECVGFQYRIDDLYDKRTNGNCWFMGGPLKRVVGAPGVNGISSGGVWIKKWYIGLF